MRRHLPRNPRFHVSLHLQSGPKRPNTTLVITPIGNETPFQAEFTDSLVANPVPWKMAPMPNSSTPAASGLPESNNHHSPGNNHDGIGPLFGCSGAFHFGFGTLSGPYPPESFPRTTVFRRLMFDVHWSCPNTAKLIKSCRQSERAPAEAGRLETHAGLTLLAIVDGEVPAGP